MRRLSPLHAGRSWWDVENVEAHVRSSLDAALDSKRARLDVQQYQRAFAFMWSLCWELSGLEHDGLTPRHVWEVRGFIAPRGPAEQFRPIELQQFPSSESAQIALAALKQRHETVFTSVERARPSGAYDPARGLAFSTYSRRMIAMRLPDWYRSDPEFGDNRYDGNRLTREISYEALAERRPLDAGADDASFLDRRSPGSRLDFVDDLNRHAYQEGIEEMLEQLTDLRPHVEEVRVANG